MDEAAFWRLIGSFDWDETGDDEAVVEPAVAALAEMSVEDIVAFEEILAEKLHALDTEAHARSTGEYAYTAEGAGFSVDLFLYSRCVVVANGRDLYAEVLADPSAFPNDMEFEALLSVASDAHERKTGEPLDHVTRVSYETFSNREGWGAPEA